MKLIFILASITLNLLANDSFEVEAKKELAKVKKSFMSEMTSAISKSGPYGAVDSCHLKAPHLIENNYGGKFIIRRASNKIRNKDNKAPEWLVPILKDLNKTTSKNPMMAKVHTIDNFKVYIEPIYVKGICLQCHGKPVDSVQKKLKKLYPNDQATGYKLGDFRGVFYVKELKE
jgi:hypothetical protein